jgi:alkylation response protein AidB-like acyl-CoA dehydrogenase
MLPRFAFRRRYVRFTDTSELADWRNTVRSFVREYWGYSDGPDFEGLMGVVDEARANPWLEKLGERGWLAAAWPKKYGGADLSVLEQFVLAQEVHEAGAPTTRRMQNLVGPTIMLHGSEEQKVEHLPPLLRGEVGWCQGFSEPGAGSDLAALTTRAVRDGDDYVINGQKIWTSGAQEADWMFALVRTDPIAPKHRGISYLLVDMHSPGITVNPLPGMDAGHVFNEVFFDDVRVPARNRIGEENRGWYVGTTTLDFERSNIALAITARKSLGRMTAYSRERVRLGRRFSSEQRLEVADRAVEIAVAELLSFVVVSIQAAGGVPNMEASRCKMYGTELWQRLANTKMHITGMHGQQLPADGIEAAARLSAPREYLGTVATTIAGGTSEIQRTIIATRGLGLPKD